jgi:putative addiction module component (TIGR02574 family)
MIHPFVMSVVQLQKELSKLSAEEKLVLADYLVREAEASTELSPAQLAELDRRYAEAMAHPEKLISPEEAERRLRR